MRQFCFRSPSATDEIIFTEDYMADEILYQAKMHPSLPASFLADPAQIDLLATLHAQIQAVTLAAVAVDADAKRFPDNWLFKFRWGKGKKKGKEELFVLVSSPHPTGRRRSELPRLTQTSRSPTDPPRPFRT